MKKPAPGEGAGMGAFGAWPDAATSILLIPFFVFRGQK